MEQSSKANVTSLQQVSSQYLLLAGDTGDLREGQFQQDLLLIVDDVDPGPVDGDDDVIFGQIGAYRLSQNYYATREVYE